MNRPAALLLIAVGLIVYGAYRALHVPALLVGPPVPALLVCFVLQAVFGIVAGVGVWVGARWSALLIVLVGAATVVTVLVESFVLGIVAYLPALLEILVAVVVSLVLATYVGKRRVPA
jgi:hypothetical protein